jgi:hypothetical protein
MDRWHFLGMKPKSSETSSNGTVDTPYSCSSRHGDYLDLFPFSLKYTQVSVLWDDAVGILFFIHTAARFSPLVKQFQNSFALVA